MKKNWWKYLTVVLVIFTVAAGFLSPVPSLDILNETIRNLYFHVTIWFSMIIILTISVVNSIRFLSSNKLETDDIAVESVNVGILLGLIGVATGSLWARFTWGAWWVNDAKLNGAAVSLLFYFAYLILRASFDDTEKRARISAVYNIFAFVMLIYYLIIYPRTTDSLHPGNGGNPGFNAYDLDNNMRKIFYPAIIAWTLTGVWLMQMGIKIKRLKRLLNDDTL